MKKASIVLALLIALSIAVYLMISFVHPVLVLTLGDIICLILLDVGFAFLLALYLGGAKNQTLLIMWTILGTIFLPLSVFAGIVKYYLSQNKKSETGS